MKSGFNRVIWSYAGVESRQVPRILTSLNFFSISLIRDWMQWFSSSMIRQFMSCKFNDLIEQLDVKTYPGVQRIKNFNYRIKPGLCQAVFQFGDLCFFNTN